MHGKYEHYRELIRYVPVSIQVGDMGVGFLWSHGPRQGEMRANPPYDAMKHGDHKFIRGNHDNPQACKKHPFWIPDGTVNDGMMFIGGAGSIDRALRIENYSWWQEEELSYLEMEGMIETYIKIKPEIMVTHDCPEEVAQELLRKIMVPSMVGDATYKLTEHIGARTRTAFQTMWNIHSPAMWIFGHWHFPFDHVLRGTQFICLPELSHRDIER